MPHNQSLVKQKALQLIYEQQQKKIKIKNTNSGVVFITSLLVPSNTGLLPQRHLKYALGLQECGSTQGRVYPEISSHCTDVRGLHPTDLALDRWVFPHRASVFEAPSCIQGTNFLSPCLASVRSVCPTLPCPQSSRCVTFLSQDTAQPYLNINNLGIFGGLLSGKKKNINQTDLKPVFPCHFWCIETVGTRLSQVPRNVTHP